MYTVQICLHFIRQNLMILSGRRPTYLCTERGSPFYMPPEEGRPWRRKSFSSSKFTRKFIRSICTYHIIMNFRGRGTSPCTPPRATSVFGGALEVSPSPPNKESLDPPLVGSPLHLIEMTPLF